MNSQYYKDKIDRNNRWIKATTILCVCAWIISLVLLLAGQTVTSLIPTSIGIFLAFVSIFLTVRNNDHLEMLGIALEHEAFMILIEKMDLK